MITGSKGEMKVRTARRSSGGVVMSDSSRTPDSASCKRARDRRRGQGQHMDIGAQLLQPLLVLDAEMLLLVDDQQAEVAELDRSAAAAHGCRSTMSIVAVGETFLGLLRAPCAATSRESLARS